MKNRESPLAVVASAPSSPTALVRPVFFFPALVPEPRSRAARRALGANDRDPDAPPIEQPLLLLTVSETASLLRTSRKSVYAMIARGQLAGVRRLGRRVLIHREELLRSLAERRTPSPERTRR